MALIDYDRAWLALKAHVVEKKSHGQRDLLAEMGRIEVDCQVPEGDGETQDRPTTPALRVAGRHG